VKPPLELHVEIETETGRTFRWDGDGPAGDRPQDLQFKTRIGDGYAESGCTLRRNEQIVYPDLGKLATHRYIGLDGTIAYEGRGTRFPTGQRQITAEAVGWMSHAKDRTCTFLGVDRDLSRWTGISAARRDGLTTAGYGPQDTQTLGDGDSARIITAAQGAWSASSKPIVDAMYDAGPGLAIGDLYYQWWKGPNVDAGDTLWTWRVILADTDTQTGAQIGANLRAAGPGSGTLVATSSTRRYAFVELLYDAGPAGSDNTSHDIAWRPVVYGYHGIPLAGPSDPKGLLASDVIKYLARTYAPLIDATDIQPTSLVLDQVVFRELITPYDAWRKLNAYERRNLAVWENRKLAYDPIDADTIDWVIRQDEGAIVQLDDPGGLGGYNGAVVRFQNIETLQADTVSPDTHPELADTDPELPANRYGVTSWVHAQLPDPNSTAGAIAIGQALLAEANRNRQPGTAVIRGHIRDAAGNWHQGWKVRAGDTVSVADHPDDRPRVVHETTWEDSSKTLTMTLDAAEQTPESMLDQIIGNRTRVS
jgi:hypothetical protein